MPGDRSETVNRAQPTQGPPASTSWAETRTASALLMADGARLHPLRRCDGSKVLAYDGPDDARAACPMTSLG
jgi:hypothetical protein